MIGGKWGNLDDALRSIEALGHELATEQVLQPGLVAAGKELHADIVRPAPRGPVAPHMADEFVVKVSKAEAEFGRLTVLVGPRAGRGSVGFVAGFVEFGTSRQAPRPFVRPAADSFQMLFPTILADHLRRQYDRVIRKYTKRSQ